LNTHKKAIDHVFDESSEASNHDHYQLQTESEDNSPATKNLLADDNDFENFATEEVCNLPLDHTI
jgi:hypothetical protein